MTTLPIVARELRVASRHAGTFWVRTLVAFGAVLVLAWMGLTLRGNGTGAELATILFGTLSSLSFGFCLLAGPLFSADSFARERREGTLGLLFLTDLRSWDVALGKLAATSLGSLYCLLAGLPVLAVPLLLGGITGQQYLGVVAVLLATLWLSLNFGLVASVWSREARTAASVTLGLLLLISVAGPVAGVLLKQFLRSYDANDAAAEWVVQLSPWAALFLALDSRSSGMTPPFLGALIFVGLVGLMALVACLLFLPRLAREIGAGGARTVAKSPTAGKAPRTQGPGISVGEPMAWLANRARRRGWLPWICLALVIGLWVVVGWLVGNRVTTATWAAVSITAHFVLKVWLAAEAPRVFYDERRSGGMELLLTTALTEGDCVNGRLAAIRRLFVGPLAFVSFMDLGILWVWLPNVRDAREFPMLLFWSLGRIALLWLDAEALAWTGSWVGVSTRGQRPTLSTLWRVVLLPYGLWMVGALLVSLISVVYPQGLGWLVGRGSGQKSISLLLAVTLALNALVSGYWRIVCERRLHREFRTCARRSLGSAG